MTSGTVSSWVSRAVGIALAWAAFATDTDAQCLMTKITGEQGVASGGFGAYLAAQGDELFVASLKSEATRARPGSIYALRRSGLHWYREQEIVAPDEVVSYFGLGLAVEGDTLVAGGFLASENIGVYVYRRTGGTWALASTLDSLPLRGTTYGSRQWAAIGGDCIAVGVPHDSSIAPWLGSVRLYRDTGTDWELEGVLVPEDRAGSFFGYALDFDGERLAVGAPDFVRHRGAAYLFERRSNAWIQTTRLEIADPRNHFGESLSLDGDRLAVVDEMTYVYELEGDTWTCAAELFPEIDQDRVGETAVLLGDRLFLSGVFALYHFRRTDDGWRYTGAIEIDDVEHFIHSTIQTVTEDFAFLASCGHNASDIWDEASDQRALDGGAVFAYSLAGEPCASLRATKRPISFGKHELRISRGPASAGRAYCLIGSMSGTSPGTRLRGQRVPLNVDPYFRWTAFAPNRGAFTNNFGRLDENGEATLRLDVPPEAVALFAGRNVDHAFLEFAGGKLVHVSNVASVRFFHRLR